MLIQDMLHWVATSIRQGKKRSMLTAAGIAIGIAAVSLLTSIGEGVRDYVMAEFSQFGTRIIAVNPGKNVTGGMGGLLSSARPLSLDDSDALMTLPYVEAVVPVVQGTGEIEFGEKGRNVTVFGVGPQMPEAWNFLVAQGRFLPQTAGGGRSSPYVVLGDKVRKELFGSQSPLGQRVRVGGMRYRIIGVIEPKGDMLGFDLDDTIYLPVELALELFDRDGLMEIDLVFSAATDSASMAARVSRLLTERHGREDFTLTTQDQMLKSLNSVLSVLTLAVAALGSVSLLVGAVGILTTLTTSVRERESEIGLLSALGATRRQIMGLFLAEAVALSLLGGIIGLALMFLVYLIAELAFPAFPMRLHLPFIMLALGLSVLIGLLAGAMPAYRAADLDPVVALRSE